MFYSIPSACAECDSSLPFSGATSIPLCYVLFPSTLLHQLFIHPLSPHLPIYFLGLPLSLVVSKFIYNTLLEILFSSILCTCPNQRNLFNPLNPELNPICYLLALLGAHHFLHVSRIRVKSLTLRRLISYTYGAPILDVSRSHTTTQHSR